MADKNVIKIETEIDIDALTNSIEEAIDLNDNELIFDRLVEVERIKKQATDVLDKVATVEAEVKSLINAKANQLYGNEWEAVKGKNYKITKSPTGAVYSIAGKVQNKFKIVKESVDTKAVTQYIKEKGKLPAGLEYNPSRGHSIRITVHDEE